MRSNNLRPVGSRFSPLGVVSLGSLGLFGLLIFMLLAADIAYLAYWKVGPADFWRLLRTPEVVSSIRLSLITSAITLVLVLLTAVPIGYGLSRYRFHGHAFANTVVDLPVVLPPVVIGISLLALFGTPVGLHVKELLKSAGISLIGPLGIVLCQYLVSVSYCIRACNASFDAVDQRLEHVALTLGCTQLQAFWRVTLPLAKNGLVAGAIMAWARAIGVFGPLMVFVGTGPRVQVMPTNMWLELNVGNIEVSLVVALIMMLLAGSALAVVHWLAPGRQWS